MKFNPRPYQKKSIDFILDNPRAGLFLDMGLGKTVSVLTAFDLLKYDRAEVGSLLVIAPLKVALLTWRQEIEKWDHLRHLRVSLIHGPQKDKALFARADVYVINYDGLRWLRDMARVPTSMCSDFPKIDMAVFDESTEIKNPSAIRSKACRVLFQATPRKVIMTGTPTPNSLMDIWGQILMLDNGERLGSTLTAFRRRYFLSGGYGGYQYYPVRGARQEISNKISDIVLTMKASDYIEMPDEITNKVDVEFPEKLKDTYDKFEKEFFLEIAGEEVEAFNTASLAMKLRQFVQGFLYGEEKTVKIHEHKLDALENILENTSSPVLVAFQFRHEVEILKERFPDMKFIYGATSSKEATENLQLWNEGKLRCLAVHPKSFRYGVNAQAGGNVIVWYGLAYEPPDQFNARLLRQGQQASKVIIYYFVMKDTVDEAIMKAVEAKVKGQDKLLQMLREWYNEKKAA